MLRDGRARADPGPKAVTKKGEPVCKQPPLCPAFRFALTSGLPTPPQQRRCWPPQLATAMGRATAQTGSRCPASRTPSARLSRRPSCSWTTVEPARPNTSSSLVSDRSPRPPPARCVRMNLLRLRVYNFAFFGFSSYQLRRKGGERRRRRSRSSCSAPLWSTPSSWH